MWFLITNSVVFYKFIFKKLNLITSLFLSLVIFSSFYTVSLLEVQEITFHLKIPEYLSILLLLLFIVYNKKVAKKPLIYFFVLLFIMFTTLIIRFFDFEPVKVWEVEDSKRAGKWLKTVVKERVSFTNLTQMLYVILGAGVFVLTSSIKIKKELLVEAIFKSLVVVNFIAVLQLYLYYSNNYEVFMHYFYDIDEFGKYSRTAFQTLFGRFKRISSVQNETSIYGYFLTSTFFTLFLLKIKPTRKQKIIIFLSLFLLLISTSFTGYLGLIYLYVLTRIYEKKGLKILIGFFFFSFLFFIFLFFCNDIFNEIILSKAGSFRERFKHGITLPLDALSKMPFFGLAIGTDRPSIMLVNILVSIGYFGFFVLSLAILYLTYNKRELKYFLLFIITIGMTQSNFHYLFVWCYMGILYQKNELLS